MPRWCSCVTSEKSRTGRRTPARARRRRRKRFRIAKPCQQRHRRQRQGGQRIIDAANKSGSTPGAGGSSSRSRRGFVQRWAAATCRRNRSPMARPDGSVAARSFRVQRARLPAVGFGVAREFHRQHDVATRSRASRCPTWRKNARRERAAAAHAGPWRAAAERAHRERNHR